MIAAKQGLKEKRSTTSAIRVFLLDLALELGIERFAAYNRIDCGSEVVSVMAEGDDDQIAAFRELVASKKPGDARASDVIVEDYDGRIVSSPRRTIASRSWSRLPAMVSSPSSGSNAIRRR
jgi:acylphosphatase